MAQSQLFYRQPSNVALLPPFFHPNFTQIPDLKVPTHEEHFKREGYWPQVNVPFAQSHEIHQNESA
jgi:hypothetical protein